MKPGIALITLHAGYSHSSIALRSIATYCRDEPYYAGISLYEPLVQGNHHWLMAQLEETKPQIIGFSTYLWNIQASLRLARNLKKLLPDSCIVFGGPEAGPRGKQLLDTETALDFVVDGEGERAFRDLVTWRIYGRGSLPKISGLIWRDSDGRILHNPVQVLPVEELPSLFTTGVADLEKPLIYWETSRGCPYRCTFCTSATDRLRTIPWERIDADLEIILGLENRTVKLLDRSFHLGTARTIRLLKRFLHSPDSLRFHLELNPDRISPEVIKIFSQASPGKFQFEIGLQTLDGQVLANIDRLMDVQHGLENIRTLIELKKHPVHLDLLVGLPDEDRSGCRDSLDRVFLLFPHHLQLGTLKLLPGTPLRQQATRFGYTWDDEPPYEILGHRHLKFLDLIRFKHYGELLERLWNSDLLVNTLMWLIPNHFAASVSDCFDYLLGTAGERIATERAQPTNVLSTITVSLSPYLRKDPVLRELLRWDLARHGRMTGKIPEEMGGLLTATKTVSVDGAQKRLTVLTLSPQATEVVNRRLPKPLASGRYALWPQRHLKGRPVRIFPVD